MSKWEEKKLGEVMTTNPKMISLSKFKGNIQYIDISSVHEGVLNGCVEYDIVDAPSRARRIINPSDIIFSTVRPNLKAYYYVKKCSKNTICSTGYVVLRAKENSDSRFIYYLVTEKSFVDYLSLVAKGSTYPAVDIKDFINARVNIPDLPTQKKIADILSAYDDLIENNNRRIELLEKAAQDLYKEWFVRFRFPNYENVTFENGFPEGWEYVRFGTIATIIDGDRGLNYPKQEEFFANEYCLFLNAGNVTKNGFNFSTNSFITHKKDALLRKGKLQYSDIVITTRGTVGNVAYYNNGVLFKNVRINSGMVILRDNRDMPTSYIYSAIQSDYMKKLIELYCSGSAQPQLPIKDMKRMKVIKPTKEIMKQYNNIVDIQFYTISILQEQNQNLKNQRDLLLPRLMSGKLEV